MAGFILLSVGLGAALWFIQITSIWILIGAMAIFGIIYLPLAWIINKKS
jgi:hypothetical protein